MRNTISKIFTIAVLVSGPAWGADIDRLAEQVRKELVTLPYYSVFDNFAFQIDGSKVILKGQVSRPTLKSGAERVVERLEEVTEVVNEIEVLPVSPNDDRIRRAVFRAIYYHPTLSRYSYRSVPPIHIIVKNGDVTLEGVVNTKGEKTIAGLQANGTSGVFSVMNNLAVEQR